jgi:signal transduction histidine kinase
MSPELVDKIFARNEHFTSLGTMSEQGTGLGLVMVKDFVAQNRGKLEVSSIEGSGSTFRVLLPVE